MNQQDENERIRKRELRNEYRTKRLDYEKKKRELKKKKADKKAKISNAVPGVLQADNQKKKPGH
jgi:hypothetical protein